MKPDDEEENERRQGMSDCECQITYDVFDYDELNGALGMSISSSDSCY